jgi:hypothetical protein
MHNNQHQDLWAFQWVEVHNMDILVCQIFQVNLHIIEVPMTMPNMGMGAYG